MSRLNMRTLIALLAALLLRHDALAQSQPAFETDTRLDKPMTTRVAGVPLKILLQEWSQQSGVSLSADAAVREYRAFARLTNRPVREAMQRLAEAFGLEWRAEKDKPDAPPRYVLFAPPSVIQQQNLLRDALAQERISLLQRALRSIPEALFQLDYTAYCNAIGRTPSYALHESAALREVVPDPEPEPAYAPLVEPSYAPLEDPDALLMFAMRRSLLMQAAQNSATWLTLHLLRLAPPQFWTELAQTRQATLPLENLTDTVRRAYEEAKAKETEAWKAYEQWMESQNASHATPSPAQPEDETPSEPAQMTPEDIEELNLDALDMEMEYIENQLIASYIPWTRTLEFQLCTTQGGGSALKPNLELQLWQLYEPEPEDDTDALSEAFARVNYRLQPIADPRWTRDLRRNWAHWLSYALIEALESAGLDGVGEFYPLKYDQVLPGEWVSYVNVQNLAVLLVQVRREYVYRVESGCVVFQARARPLARLQDAPEYLLNRWTQLSEPSLEWATDIARRLAPEQIQLLRAHRESALAYLNNTQRTVELTEAEERNRSYLLSVIQESTTYWLLRWYAQLPPLLQKRLQRGERLLLSELPPPAREALFAILETQATVFPCYADHARSMTELLQCSQVGIDLSYDPDAVARLEEFVLSQEGAPPRHVRYTENVWKWTFTLRGEDCPDWPSIQTSFDYQVLKTRSLKDVEPE